jgi:peptidoglycan/LPS O-acetylase OafA/YrhL
VDVLRACAAILVVLLHTGRDTGPLAVLKPIAAFGWSGVGLFLVLSGFSIHFRWAASDVPHHAFTPKKFFTRRFFRLYPTYVAAVLVTLALLAIEGALHADTSWVIAGGSQPAWVLGLNQLLVVPANVIPVAFVGVAWSLGLEVQLYIAYAVIVRRIRSIGVLKIVAGTLVIALAYRLGSEFVTSSMPVGQFFPGGRATTLSRVLYAQLPSRAFEWFLGVLAAEAYFGRVKLPRWTRSPLAAAALLLTAGLAFRYPQGVEHLNGHFFRISDVLLDPLVGVSYFVLLLAVVRYNEALTNGRRSVQRIAGALAAVGIFSYSMYLLHDVMLGTGARVASDVGVSGTIETLCMWLFVLAGSWLFHLAVERPFITGAGDRFVLERLRRRARATAT